jgi:hypothetical protein
MKVVTFQKVNPELVRCPGLVTCQVVYPELTPCPGLVTCQVVYPEQVPCLLVNPELVTVVQLFVVRASMIV